MQLNKHKHLAIKRGDDIIDLHSTSYKAGDELLEGKDAIEVIRHTGAHILAQAISRLFPNTEFGVGPPTSTGFYHEFRSTVSVSSNDFPIIEAEMRKIISEKIEINKKTVSRTQAEKLFEEDKLKLKILSKISGFISIYSQGAFSTLCGGPHLLNTGLVNPDCFKIQSISGVNWQDELVQRIVVACFYSKEELDLYLEGLNLQLSRDHRKLGRKMKLFISSDYTPGID